MSNEHDHESYPHYGVAPHYHDTRGGRFLGSTRIKDRSEWPLNFIEDPEVPGCGTYLCPACVDTPALRAKESEK